MKTERQVFPAVFIAVVKDGKILLQKRKATGFMDGLFDLPSGHVEPKESITKAAVRELKEETGLETSENKLKLIHVGQSFYNMPYIYFAFLATEWRGAPALVEPEHVDEIDFYPIEKLPKTVPHILPIIESVDKEAVTFGFSEITEAEFLGQ